MFFEDFRVGDRGVTPGRTITETDLVLFAALSGDWHPVHTNVEYAKGSLFGERIAHGLLILAVSSGLMFRAEKYGRLPEAAIALWGLEKVRFVAPVRIGDTIHLENEVVQMSEINGERGLITMRHRVRNQRGEEVLTFTMKILVRRRGQGGRLHG